MSIDEFTKLFNYMSDRFNAIANSLETKANKSDIDRIMRMLDSLSKRLEISEDERLVMGHQLNRLDKWTHELANEIGYKLST